MPPSVSRPTFGLSRYGSPDENDWAAYLAHVDAARPAASRLSAGAAARILVAEAMRLGHPVRASRG